MLLWNSLFVQRHPPFQAFFLLLPFQPGSAPSLPSRHRHLLRLSIPEPRLVMIAQCAQTQSMRERSQGERSGAQAPDISGHQIGILSILRYSYLMVFLPRDCSTNECLRL